MQLIRNTQVISTVNTFTTTTIINTITLMGIEKPSWELLNKVCMYVCINLWHFNFDFFKDMMALTV